MNPSKKAKELIDMHENYVRKIIRASRNFQPMLAFSVKGNIIPVVNISEREIARMGMEIAKVMKAEWYVFMSEAYSLNVEPKKGESYEQTVERVTKNYRHGNLEQEFLAGNEDVIEVIIVNVNVRNADGTYEKVGTALEKKTLKRVAQGETQGYLGGDQ